ncbi:low-temperature-induced 65 kDa protein-like isoform X2 [Aristolochia californica]|uniref:low-temperature-induced 65 kDa protein-like isoform X2 n=1 Tax=Aristolochia californica TaxID=171875 RepID=UPI0035E23523
MKTSEVPIHERNHQQVPHNTAVEGEEEHHHEKKSVLRKVKDKARKIKDTLMNHGHGQEHEGNLDGYRDDEESVDEEVEDPEVHGTPFYETTEKFAVEDAISGQRSGDVGNLPHTGEGPQTDGLKYAAGETDTGSSTTPERDPHAPKEPGESHSPGNYESKVTDPTHSGGAEADVDPIVRDLEAVNVSDEPNYGPTGSQDQFSPDKSADKAPIKRENLESILSQEHQPTTYAGKITSAASSAHGESHSPGNYESKVTDPILSGGAEADVDPTVRDFKAVNVSDEPNYGPTGSQDQFSPDKSADKAPNKIENLESIPSQELQPTTNAGKITSAASSAHGESQSPENYESKVTDPTLSGGAEADVDPTVRDFEAVNVSDEPNYGPTGSQDQFSPDKSADKAPIKSENLESIPSQELQPTTYAGKITSAASSAHGESQSPGNYESKVTDPILSGGAEADVDPTVRDFEAVNVSDELNYGPTGSQDQFSPDKSADKAPIKSENLESIPSQEHLPTTYAGKITSTASSAHGETHSPGNYESEVTDPTLSGGAEADVDPIVRDFEAVNVSDEPNYGPTGSQAQFSPDKSADKAPIKNENLESIPSQEQPTTYAGKITSAASALAGTAVCAKDAVASKFGYGSKNEKDESGEGGDQKSSTAGENYGQKIRETVAPVYEKVAEAGSAEVTKIQETTTRGSGGRGEEVSVEETEGGVKRSGKGVPVSQYLSQRKPGGEDRALSQLITDAIDKRKDVPEEDESSTVKAQSSPGSGKGVVGLIRGAVTSLFGKGGDSHESAESAGQNTAEAEVGKEN